MADLQWRGQRPALGAGFSRSFYAVSASEVNSLPRNKEPQRQDQRNRRISDLTSEGVVEPTGPYLPTPSQNEDRHLHSLRLEPTSTRGTTPAQRNIHSS